MALAWPSLSLNHVSCVAVRGLRHLGYLLLFSRAHQQGAGLELEYPQPNPNTTDHSVPVNHEQVQGSWETSTVMAAETWGLLQLVSTLASELARPGKHAAVGPGPTLQEKTQNPSAGC